MCIKHAFMPVVVRAVEREAYDAFIAEKVALVEAEKDAYFKRMD